MPLPVAVCTALALAPDADEAAVLTAVAGLQTDLATAQNAAATPPLDRFVPRADYDAALARARNAEARLAAIETAQREAEIDAVLQQAQREGKITPATLDYHRACCRAEGGLDRFKAFLASAPPVIGAASGLDQKPAPAAPAPPPELLAVAAQFGHSLADLNTYGGLQ